MTDLPVIDPAVLALQLVADELGHIGARLTTIEEKINALPAEIWSAAHMIEEAGK